MRDIYSMFIGDSETLVYFTTITLEELTKLGYVELSNILVNLS
jgi:hypothetical protein